MKWILILTKTFHGEAEEVARAGRQSFFVRVAFGLEVAYIHRPL